MSCTEPFSPIISGIIYEEWRSISGHINYQVSNIGRIRNITTGRILKLSSDKDGYLQVDLFNPLHENCCRSRSSVHTIVAQEFLETWYFHEMHVEEEKEVYHIDNNLHNNCVDNLKWASPSIMKRFREK